MRSAASPVTRSFDAVDEVSRAPVHSLVLALSRAPVDFAPSRNDTWVDVLVAGNGCRLGGQDAVARTRPRAGRARLALGCGGRSDPELASMQVAAAMTAVQGLPPSDDEDGGELKLEPGRADSDEPGTTPDESGTAESDGPGGARATLALLRKRAAGSYFAQNPHHRPTSMMPSELEDKTRALHARLGRRARARAPGQQQQPRGEP
jgi:hypothetical protein